jgi:hypothetical protein
MDFHSDTFVDRKFQLLFEDTVLLMKEAIGARREKWNPRESVLARASIMSSALLIEAAANACLDTLKSDLRKRDYKYADGRPVLEKFEFFLKLKHPSKRWDHKSPLAEKARELVEIRSLLVHPKPYSTKWVKKDERTYIADLGETKFLKLPRSFVVLSHSDALVALKAAMSFLNHFFKNLCEFSNDTVLDLLISQREYPPPKNVAVVHNPIWIQWHDEWGIEIDFLVDVQMVKDANARFQEHLRKQEEIEARDAHENT